LQEKQRKTPHIEHDIENLRDFYNAPLEYDKIKKGYYLQEAIFLLKGELFLWLF
jgi:hypothetical protein